MRIHENLAKLVGILIPYNAGIFLGIMGIQWLNRLNFDTTGDLMEIQDLAVELDPQFRWLQKQGVPATFLSNHRYEIGYATETWIDLLPVCSFVHFWISTIFQAYLGFMFHHVSMSTIIINHISDDDSLNDACLVHRPPRHHPCGIRVKFLMAGVRECKLGTLASGSTKSHFLLVNMAPIAMVYDTYHYNSQPTYRI